MGASGQAANERVVGEAAAKEDWPPYALSRDNDLSMFCLAGSS